MWCDRNVDFVRGCVVQTTSKVDSETWASHCLARRALFGKRSVEQNICSKSVRLMCLLTFGRRPWFQTVVARNGTACMQVKCPSSSL